MEKDRDRLKKIIEQESQRLDNQTVFGGFNQYVKKMIQSLSIPVPEEIFLSVNRYPQMSKPARSIFLKNLETCIIDGHQPQPSASQPSSPIKPVDFQLSVRTIKELDQLLKTAQPFKYLYPRRPHSLFSSSLPRSRADYSHC